MDTKNYVNILFGFGITFSVILLISLEVSFINFVLFGLFVLLVAWLRDVVYESENLPFDLFDVFYFIIGATLGCIAFILL